MRRWLSRGGTAVCFLVSVAYGKEITTNNVAFSNAPPWLTEGQLETSTSRIQNYLQWDARRIKATYYTDAKAFEAVHSMGPSVVAFFRRSDGSLHVGPTVDAKNFDRFFGHEMVHAVFFQKYKGAIPKWLEEGLANYIGRNQKVDYKWLARQTIGDVTKLEHPFKDSNPHLHYATSTALIEMIASKCSLPDLLQLSVGRKMETYLSTFCEIPDINAAFQAWLKKPH